MSGIQPPVLSDRGLVGAVEALALDLAGVARRLEVFDGTMAVRSPSAAPPK